MSGVASLEQINVLRHQVFLVLKRKVLCFLFLCDLVNCPDVRFLFQYGVGFGLGVCYSNVRLGRSRSARLITKSVYTGVSEWLIHLHIGVPARNPFQRFAFPRVLKTFVAPSQTLYYGNNFRKLAALVTDIFSFSRGCPLTRELTV